MLGGITGQTIKSAIALNIKKNITLRDNKSFKIYKEKTIQNFKRPCFFIWEMDVGQEKLMGDSYNLTYQMNVRFHPEETAEDLYSYLSQLGIELLESLARLDVPILVDNETERTKPVIGKQMSFNVVDGVLQMYVTYTTKAKKSLAQSPEMQVLSIT